MPLTSHDRRFLKVVDRLKIYLLGLGVAVFLFVLAVPATQLSLATSVVIAALCGVLWVTQRLLTLITLLDIELAKMIGALKHTLSKEQRQELSHR